LGMKNNRVKQWNLSTTIAFDDSDFVHWPFQPHFLQFSFTP
jgi:hypothetical protein